MADWNEIKKEYITTKTSYRKLAKKYGVSFQSLQCIALREKWVDKKRQIQDKTETKLVESASDKKATIKTDINRVVGKLIDKLEASIDKLEVIDGGSIKSYSSALKDLRDIAELKSDLDYKEQVARIKKLEKEAEKDEKDNEVVVIIGNEETEEYSE